MHPCDPVVIQRRSFSARLDPGTNFTHAERTLLDSRDKVCFPQLRDRWDSVYQFRYDWKIQNVTDGGFNDTGNLLNRASTCYGTGYRDSEMFWDLALHSGR